MTNWFKVARADRDLIVSRCGEKAPGALAVWLAFCDIANQARCPKFRSSGAEIARVAGVSRRTVERMLPILKGLGLVTWTTTHNPETGGLEANDYMLPTFAPSDKMTGPLPSECRHPTDKEVGSPCRSYNGKTEKTEKTVFLQPATPTAGELPLSGEPDRKPKPKAPRPKNPIFDALAALDGGSEKLTESGAGAVAKAMKEIRKAYPEVTAQEIERRAENYRAHFPVASLTSSALTKHWARCANPPQPRVNGHAVPGGELGKARDDLRKLESASRRERSDPDFPSRLKAAQRRVADLEGGQP